MSQIVDKKELDDKTKYQMISEIIDECKDREGSLIQVLHGAQNIYGYLPIEVQQFISEGMDIPFSEISGVITFYSYFFTEPRGEHIISTCLGSTCYVRGGQKLIDKMEELLQIKPGETTADNKFTFEIAHCIGACGLAPAIMIDDTVYQKVKPDELESILAKY